MRYRQHKLYNGIDYTYSGIIHRGKKFHAMINVVVKCLSLSWQVLLCIVTMVHKVSVIRVVRYGRKRIDQGFARNLMLVDVRRSLSLVLNNRGKGRLRWFSLVPATWW